MKMRYLVFTFWLFAFESILSMLSAQTMSSVEEYFFNYSILQSIKTYELNARMYDAEARDEFERLFESQNVAIYNDLLGLSSSPILTLTDYVSKLQQEAQSVQIRISNVRKSTPHLEGGQWLSEVTFDKSISYTNRCGLLFSSIEHYQDDHHLKVTFVWTGRRAVIRSISGFVDQAHAAPLPDVYEVLESTQKGRMYDERLRFDGLPLDYNEFGQAILPIPNDSLLTIDDPDIQMIRVYQDDCNIFSMLYRSRRWRLKVHGDFALGHMYQLKRPQDNISTSSVSGEILVDLGYIFPPVTKDLRMGIFIGTGVSSSKLNIKARGVQYDYYTVDIDNDQYKRNYQIERLNQKNNLLDIVVPLYIDMDWQLSSKFSLYADLGVKNYFNLKADLDMSSCKYTVVGQYAQYNNLVLDDRAGIEGFTRNGHISDARVAAMPIVKYSLDIMGALGFRYRLDKSWYLDFGLQYQHSILSPVEEGFNYYSKPIVKWSGIEEEIENLSIFSEKLNRHGIRLTAGLIFKF